MPEFIPDPLGRFREAVRRCHNDGVLDWRDLSYGMGRGEHPRLLEWVWQRLPHDQLLEALPDAWSSPDFPEQYMPRRRWLPIFRAAGYHEDSSPAIPPASITLWRGGTKRTRMAWTASRETAEWFRDRRVPGINPYTYDTSKGPPGELSVKPGQLWTVTVGADRLLAHYHHEAGRGEDEYVIDPTGLRPRPLDAAH